jgi:hypothetical protein
MALHGMRHEGYKFYPCHTLVVVAIRVGVCDTSRLSGAR